MSIISQTISYNGFPVKMEGGKVYLRAFGTTIQNHSMHWSWMEVPVSKLKPGLKKEIEKYR